VLGLCCLPLLPLLLKLAGQALVCKAHEGKVGPGHGRGHQVIKLSMIC